jgi:predicted amidohydrolase YtcJ
VVLDQDPFRVAPSRLKDVRALLTVIDGRVIYDGRNAGTR